ncbi:hypothetical protein OC25_23145 [Pedobacter kyungheensis]|uniref:Entericidin n=1 Tax=Pedobacter kyungheensis TaxID=1069985 RepID=A0A0C1D2Q3_9SPHI|nr:hypothetical protein [Pedobacter kyungheensis]KIA91156.1 hypothetical protein OC25_23145 [Pedobacter kyungheensis]
MKTKAMILAAALGLAFSACSGNKADQQNADSLHQYTDTNIVADSIVTDSTADSTTNAPADVKH